MGKGQSKVTSKRQVTVPKAIADRYGIGPGDVLRWDPAGDHLRVTVGGGQGVPALTVQERLRLFDEATARRDRRTDVARSTESEATGAGERGWTREELYRRG